MNILIYLLYLVFMCVVIGLLGVITYKKRNTYNTNNQSKVQEYLASNPDSAIINVVTSQGYSYSSEVINVESVDGVEPVFTFVNKEYKVYVAPGQHQLSVTHLHVKHSASNKTSKHVTVGPLIVDVNLEPKQEYALGFDLETQQFVLKRKIK